MSTLKIYNTLSKRKEVFQPLNPDSKSVGIYVCGNTVYDYSHIGNARVFVFFDVVVRYLRMLGYNVNYVRNITDIDDKIIKRAQQEHTCHTAITARFIAALHEDLAHLGIDAPTREPKVTDHLPQIIEIINILLNRGYAYIASNGDIYYDISKFKKYGELAQQDLSSLRAGARVDANEAKRNALDFALWKVAKPGEPAWQSPWGAGRPGWHAECSAMARHYLGDHFEIHGGGVDLQFPHHQNEIAQSEASCTCYHTEKSEHSKECLFVKYWMHVGFVSVDNEKMSKSLGNFFTVREVLQRYHSEAVRFFLLTSHYRSPLNYSTEQLDAARESLVTLYTALRGLESPCAHDDEVAHDAVESIMHIAITEDADAKIKLARQIWDNFSAAIDDDFNIPLALSFVFELAHALNKERTAKDEDKKITQIYAKLLRNKMGAILGILQHNPEDFFQTGLSAENRGEIDSLVAERIAARKNKEWAKADELRKKLSALGVALEDTATGTTWKKS